MNAWIALVLWLAFAAMGGAFGLVTWWIAQRDVPGILVSIPLLIVTIAAVVAWYQAYADETPA